METERENASSDMEHLVFKIVLSKGDIDIVWLKDIQIRVTEIENKDNVFLHNEPAVIKPFGMKKRKESANTELEIKDYWNREEMDYYVLSPNEESAFLAFIMVKKNSLIAADVLILGTKPFYSIGNRRFKHPSLIQWKSSIVVLQGKTKAS